MVKKIQSDAGFTLVEVLIALVVFIVGVLGLGLLQLSSIKGNSLANQVTEAIVFGSDQIERMMAWAYSDPQLNSADNSHPYTLKGVNYNADGSQAHPSGHYNAYWEVTDNSPEPDSKTIAVTVVWEEKGVQKNLRLSTVKARK